MLIKSNVLSFEIVLSSLKAEKVYNRIICKEFLFFKGFLNKNESLTIVHVNAISQRLFSLKYRYIHFILCIHAKYRCVKIAASHISIFKLCHICRENIPC